MENIKPKLLSKKYIDKLKSKFDILDIIEFKEFDTNFSILRQRLINIKKQEYQVNERIIIEHFDTDVYHKRLNYGLNLYNLLEEIENLDIPFFTIILVTNHFGIKREIDEILKDQNNDSIKVIETFITKTHYDTNAVTEFDVAVDKIKFSALSMLGAPRSHRFALYNYLKENNLLEKIQLSIRGLKK